MNLYYKETKNSLSKERANLPLGTFSRLRYYLRMRLVGRIGLCLSLGMVLGVSFVFSSDEFAAARKRMVKEDLEARGIQDLGVLRVMGRVPRHAFVNQRDRDRAYNDHPLPIGEGQTISQPYVVALMTEALNLGLGDRVLEIVTGSGYQAAVLAEIVENVYTIEIREELAGKARRRLKELGYHNVHVKHADGYFGWEEHAPFDAIIITAAANHIPPSLIKQLKKGGRLIIPLGRTTFYQTLTLATKVEHGLTLKQMTGVAFVPMTGEVRK
jgi:protein-L-isoaspartate(D-aspartate) O-methyltransferase